jgi:hypothetical protein
MNNKKDLALEEWDFERSIAKFNLNNDQVYFCMTYEYAREVPTIINAFRQDSAYHHRTDSMQPWHFGVLVYMSDVSDDPMDTEVVLEVVDAPIGFPDKSYQSIFRDHKITPESFEPFDRSASVREPTGGEPGDSIHKLYVNWDQSDDHLVNDFSQWIKKARRGPAFERRGRSRIRKSMAELKALAALRLIRHYGTAEAAMSHTQTLGFPNGLYANLNDWYAAKSTAVKTIELWKKAALDFNSVSVRRATP